MKFSLFHSGLHTELISCYEIHEAKSKGEGKVVPMLN